MRLRLAVLISLFAVLFGLTSCGGYSSQMNPPVATPGATSMALISLGDAPADNILSFEITVNSATLTDANGATVPVVSKPFRIELTRLAGTFVPVASLNVPQGTYTKITVTFSNPEIVVLNADGTTSEREPPLANSTATFNFSPSLVVGSTAAAINVDLNVAQSVTFDSAGNATVNPTISVSAGTAAGSAPRREDNGQIEDTKGTVSAVGSDNFSLTQQGAAQPLTFQVNSSTKFEGVSNLSALKTGMQVEVDAALQPGGSLLATKVEVEGEEQESENEMRNAMELEGLIVDLTGQPVTQLSVVMRDVSSGNSNIPALGSLVQVAITSNTRFAIRGDLPPSLPFTPTFSPTNISKGQNVEIDADGIATQPIPARKIALHEQSLTGAVSSLQTGAVTSFTVTVPADSAFAKLTGKQTIVVYQVAGTEVHDVTVADSATVRVRGLLFVDGGILKMVAKRISKP